jgi:hypothetical protein
MMAVLAEVFDVVPSSPAIFPLNTFISLLSFSRHSKKYLVPCWSASMHWKNFLWKSLALVGFSLLASA